MGRSYCVDPTWDQITFNTANNIIQPMVTLLATFMYNTCFTTISNQFAAFIKWLAQHAHTFIYIDLEEYERYALAKGVNAVAWEIQGWLHCSLKGGLNTERPSTQ